MSYNFSGLFPLLISLFCVFNRDEDYKAILAKREREDMERKYNSLMSDNSMKEKR